MIPPSTSHTMNDEGTLYDVHKIIEASEKLPVVRAQLKQLLDQLEIKCWSDDRPEGDKSQPQFAPMEVVDHWLEEPKFKFHYDKALQSDLQYPIIIRRSDNIIIDGMHRLLKAYLLKQLSIKAVYLNGMPKDALISQAPKAEQA